MKLLKKYILITSIIPLALLYSSLACGQELIPSLKGKWIGTALLQATSTGFTSLKNSINFNFIEQSKLELKGNAERKSNGQNISCDFSGYLDKSGRNIYLVNQNSKKIFIGYIMANNLIKLYSWDNDENDRVNVYILKKSESVDIEKK